MGMHCANISAVEGHVKAVPLQGSGSAVVSNLVRVVDDNRHCAAPSVAKVIERQVSVSTQR